MGQPEQAMTSRNHPKAPEPRSLAGVASLAPSVASRLLTPLLVAEAAAFVVAAASGKIPASLITAVRALLTF
jgi:hypothetical protein